MSMVEQFAEMIHPVLRLPMVRRTRRNHALEHATITVLSSRVKSLSMAGRSDSGGFVLFGDVPTEAVESAVQTALKRMRDGEKSLAIHPNCGTNLVTTSFCASVAAMLGLKGTRNFSALNRLPMVMALVAVAVVLSQPLGFSLQRHITTDGDPADLEVVSVTRSEVGMPFGGGKMVVHRVSLRSE
jgi:hypothetical protein